MLAEPTGSGEQVGCWTVTAGSPRPHRERLPFLLRGCRAGAPPPPGHHLPAPQRGLTTPPPWPTFTCPLCLRAPGCPAPVSLTGHRRLVSAQAGPCWDTTQLPSFTRQTPTHPSSLSSEAAFSGKPSLTTSPSSPVGLDASSGLPPLPKCPWHGVVHALLGSCSLRLSSSFEDREVWAGLSVGTPGQGTAGGSDWRRRTASPRLHCPLQSCPARPEAARRRGRGQTGIRRREPAGR